MAITIDDFSKIWASTSPLTPYEFSEDNYKSGWNFVGGTPPSRQMWDFLQKNNDEKMQYLANNYLPLSGGTLTGTILSNTNVFVIRDSLSDEIVISGDNGASAPSLSIHGRNRTSGAGSFYLRATDGTNTAALEGKPNGTLTWDGAGLGGTYMGLASSGVATNFTLPKQGTYLVITSHNSTEGSNSIFIVRTGGNRAFKMAGGSNITMTCSGTQITVTSSGGNVGVYYIFLE